MGDVYQTAMQVLIRFNRGSMTTVFRERAMAVLALIVLLRRSAGDQLDALGYVIPPVSLTKKMHVVGCHHIPKRFVASKLNANTGDDRAQILVEIAFGDSGE